MKPEEQGDKILILPLEDRIMELIAGIVITHLLNDNNENT